MRKGIAIVLVFVIAAVTVASCIPGTTNQQPKGPQSKIRIANVKLNKEIETMLIITGEAWNDDTETMTATITGTLYDANGKVIKSGDQTLPAIPAGRGVPFNIPFPPDANVAKQTVVVKSVEKVESN